NLRAAGNRVKGVAAHATGPAACQGPSGAHGVRIQRQISAGVAVLPYISMPTRKTRAAAYVTNAAASSRRTAAAAISHAGTSPMPTRRTAMTGLVGGNSVAVLAVEPVGLIMTGPRTRNGRNGSRNTMPCRLLEFWMSSMVAPAATNRAA